MASTITIKPNGLYKRSSSSNCWTNYGRLYDGDESTYPTNAGGGYCSLNIDLSWLPGNMYISSFTVRVVSYRGTSGFGAVSFGWSDLPNPTSAYKHVIAEATLNTGGYQTTETRSASMTVSQADSDKMAAAPYKFITVSGSNNSNRWYELYIDVTYDYKYFYITKNLTDCTLSNSATQVDANAGYSTLLNVPSGYVLDSCTVTMGDVNVTASAWNASTNTISIASVTGDLVITAECVLAGIPIYSGANQASEIWVGTTKATALYVGTAKVL